MDNIIYCFYFDEYDMESNKSGLFLDSTKYLIPKLKYYKKIYNDIPLTQYYIIDQDCYIIMNKFNFLYSSYNNTDCYDLINVNYDVIEKFFKDNNIKYTLCIPDMELLDNIIKPLDDNEFACLLKELHIKQDLL